MSPPLDDGTTAVAALFLGDRIYVANVGDSRAILVKRSGRVEALSDDHKPNRPDEAKRIRSLGGRVLFHGVWRVNGILAVSRAIGDRILKQFVTGVPEIKSCRISPSTDAYVVLASDGLWDTLTHEDVSARRPPPVVRRGSFAITQRINWLPFDPLAPCARYAWLCRCPRS